MSYLDFPSFNVTGSFYTDPSTMDNDPSHYDESCTNPSPWQDPGGSHFFTFQDVLATQIPNRSWTPPTVSAAFDQDGNASFTDPLVNSAVGSVDAPGGLLSMLPGPVTLPFSPAKMVDLDVYQQGVSSIFGFFFKFQIGSNTLVGAMDPCSLNSIRFDRVLPTRGWQPWDSYSWGSFGGDTNASGVFQSVVRIPASSWPVASGSTILDQLRAVTGSDSAGNLLLSVRMVLDGYQNVPWHSEDFRIGRLLATFGPYQPGEPVQCVAGRWLQGYSLPGSSPTPGMAWNQPSLYGAPFEIKQGSSYGPFGTTYAAIDLANALMTTEPGGEPLDLGELTLFLQTGTGATPVGQPFQLNSVAYSAGGGIIRLPLTALQATQATQSPFYLSSSRTDIGGFNNPAPGPNSILWQENANGIWIVCDGRSFQLASDSIAYDQAVAQVYANQFGLPAAAALGLQAGVFPCYQGNGAATVPWSGGYAGDSPSAEGALTASLILPASPLARKDLLLLSLNAVADPGSRTPELPSQLYFVCIWGGAIPQPPPNLTSAPPQEQMVSAVVWSAYPVNENPDFVQVQNILKVYDKLFPAMHARIDLLDHQTFFTFSKNPPWEFYYAGTGGPETIEFVPGKTISAGAIPYYLTREPNDPRFMPIMRDLSPNRLLTLLYFIWNLQQQTAAEGPPAPAANPHAHTGPPAPANPHAPAAKGAKS